MVLNNHSILYDGVRYFWEPAPFYLNSAGDKTFGVRIWGRAIDIKVRMVSVTNYPGFHYCYIRPDVNNYTERMLYIIHAVDMAWSKEPDVQDVEHEL